MLKYIMLLEIPITITLKRRIMLIFKQGLVIAGVVAGLLGLTGVASADSNYEVKAGDTLSSIALNHNTTAHEIGAINNIENLDLIHVGQELVIIGDVNTTPTTPAQPTETNQTEAPVTAPTPVITKETEPTPQPEVTTVSGGSTHDQFIQAGGTEAMWQNIVMPESTGDVNATNGQYHGLGQTNQSWGYGSVAEQTQGMLQYAQERFGSVDNAISFRQANNFW